MPSIRRTSLSPPPLHPSHFPFTSCQPLRRSSLCISPWTSAAPITNAPLGQRGDALQPHSPTILPVIPAPCDRIREPIGAVPSSQLPVIASPPGSFGRAPSLSSPPSPRPPQQWCQPMPSSATRPSQRGCGDPCFIRGPSPSATPPSPSATHGSCTPPAAPTAGRCQPRGWQ
ncbi:ena/VASP-like protein [Aix galericulata]|nr:ena/VASP-like protein [Aix galericulata]